MFSRLTLPLLALLSTGCTMLSSPVEEAPDQGAPVVPANALYVGDCEVIIKPRPKNQAKTTLIEVQHLGAGEDYIGLQMDFSHKAAKQELGASWASAGPADYIRFNGRRRVKVCWNTTGDVASAELVWVDGAGNPQHRPLAVNTVATWTKFPRILLDPAVRQVDGRPAEVIKIYYRDFYLTLQIFDVPKA